MSNYPVLDADYVIWDNCDVSSCTEVISLLDNH